MVRSPSVDKNGLKRGAWSEEEDNKLRAYIERYGHWNWRQLPKFAGIARCGKSCRLRWLNYLRPGLKKGSYSKEEEEIIIKLREELGNKWSTIAEKLPGRTDNEIKNYWNSHLKKLMQRDKKSTGKTEERSQNMLVMDQKEQQDYSVSHSESTDQKIELNVEVAASAEEISSSCYDYSTPLDGAENSFTSEESFPKFFESFWTEPFYLSTSYNQISSPTSYNSRVLDLENWDTENGISLEESLVESFQSLSTEPVSSNASDGLISPSTSSNSTVTNWTETVYSKPSKDIISPSTSHNSTIINSEETYADAFGGFWTEPFSLDTSNNLSILPQLPPAEEGVSSTSFLEYDLDLFNQI